MEKALSCGKKPTAEGFFALSGTHSDIDINSEWDYNIV